MRSFSTVRNRVLLYFISFAVSATPCLAQTLENRVEEENKNAKEYYLTLNKSSGENSVKSDLNSNSIIKEDIEYYMQTDRSIYNLGENVEMLYRVTNLRDEEVMFEFTYGPIELTCDWMVDKNELRIWDNLYRDVAMVLTSFSLSPSESHEYTHTWNMTDFDGNTISPGHYDITAALGYGPFHKRYVPVSVPIKISDWTYIKDEKPTLFSLQNFPNPFNSSTIIKYQIPENTKVSLDVYNISGQKIRTLVDRIESKGLYQVKFDANNLSSGIYFYQLRTQDTIKSNKMLLVK